MKINRPFTGLALLACLFLFFLIIISAVSPFVLAKFGETAAAVRILTVMQDIFVFIVPALATAMLSTRLPATMLRIDKLPSMKLVGLSLLVLVCAIPAMNLIVHLNESITFPGEMDAKLRAMEDAASGTVDLLTGGNSVGSFVLTLLIVGVLAGLSEELFFRGALQRLFGATNMGVTGAIWMAAFLFSAVHFQFYGFVPRMLLGAYFGYLAVWSGSLWLPIIAHAFNNCLAVAAMWLSARGSALGDIADTYGSDLTSVPQAVACLLSVVAVTSGLSLIKRLSR